MRSFIVLAIIVVAVVFASLAGRAAWKRSFANLDSRANRGSRANPGSRAGQKAGEAREELVAVIAAAVAAASGMDQGSFRILGLRASAQEGTLARRGINTPAWGHIERFIRGE